MLPAWATGLVIFLLCLLISQVNGLIVTTAKCLPGYQWMFSSAGQSPCDVAAELASVCAGGDYNLVPLPVNGGYVYLGPQAEYTTHCTCSSVFYSLLSACAYCQGQNYLRWSKYRTNCSDVYIATYPQQVPPGVSVPKYAYQNVSISDTFNVTLARLGSESSETSSNTGSRNNTPAIVGGVVGGLVLIGSLIGFLRFCSKRKRTSQADNSSFQQSPELSFVSNTTDLPISTTVLPSGPSRSPKKYSPSMFKQHSPPFSIQNVLPDYTGKSASSKNSAGPSYLRNGNSG